MEVYWLATVCFLALQTLVSGHTLTANGKETQLSDAVKEYIAQAVSELYNRHDRDIQQLKDVIDSQQKQIEDLRADQVLCHAVNSELENRISSLESFDVPNMYEKEEEVQQDTTRSLKNDLFQGGAIEDTAIASEKPESVNDLGTKLDNDKGTNRRVRRATTENQVAFSASMTHDQEHLGQGQDITFNHVITNVGNAYNGNHGTFLAPVAGVYVFYFSLHSPGARADLVVNGSVIVNLYIGNDQASQLAVVSLRQGDDVSVQNLQSDKLFWGNGYSTFSGFLLYEIDDAEVILG